MIQRTSMAGSKFMSLDMVNSFDVSFDAFGDGNSTAAASDAVQPSPDVRRRAATSRPINPAELTIEDSIILEMKLERRRDSEIANRLRGEGYVDYVDKTIGTRWSRLRKKVANYRDQELDQGERYWKTEEDIHLINSVIRAKTTIGKLIRQAEDKLWHFVVRELHDADRNLMFSTRACQERYETIREGLSPWYTELTSCEEQKRLGAAKQALAVASKAFRVAEEKADERVKTVLESHRNDKRSSTSSRTASTPDIHTEGATTEPSPPESSQDLRIQLSSLPTWMFEDSEREKKVQEAYEKLKDASWLPRIQVMRRKQLVAELSARGFQSSGPLDQMRSILRKARKGNIGLPRSSTPLLDITTLRTILLGEEKRKISTSESKGTKRQSTHVEIIRKLGAKRKAAEVEDEDGGRDEQQEEE